MKSLFILTTLLSVGLINAYPVNVKVFMLPTGIPLAGLSFEINIENAMTIDDLLNILPIQTGGESVTKIILATKVFYQYTHDYEIFAVQIIPSDLQWANATQRNILLTDFATQAFHQQFGDVPIFPISFANNYSEIFLTIVNTGP